MKTETAFITHDDNDGDTNQALCVTQDSQGDVYIEDYKEDVLHIQDTLLNNEGFKKHIEI